MCLQHVDQYPFDNRLVMLCFFFFSSRRRHTRFKCDWSSDVCSSDLLLTCSESDRRQDLLACVPPSPGHSEGICSMNLIFRRCSISILSGAAASTALTATPHHALWNLILSGACQSARPDPRKARPPVCPSASGRPAAAPGVRSFRRTRLFNSRQRPQVHSLHHPRPRHGPLCNSHRKKRGQPPAGEIPSQVPAPWTPHLQR